MVIGWSLAKLAFFYVDRKSNIATITVFNLGPYGKLIKSLFLETTKMIVPKLYISSHLMVPKKAYFFFFSWIRNSRWPQLQKLVLTIESFWENELKLILRNYKNIKDTFVLKQVSDTCSVSLWFKSLQDKLHWILKLTDMNNNFCPKWLN